jgi:predicted DCC family thiol-disulfide oxidoreductase YuxK
MKKLFSRINQFFFARTSATGFGMMRSAWAAIVFWSMLLQWPEVTRYYTNLGIMPQSLMGSMLRQDHRFSILDYITDPHAVFALYLLLLLAAFCAMIGLFPRFSTIFTCVLLFSFHERNTLPLAGGETVLRVLGFLLMIAPGISAFSLDRAALQWKSWVKSKKLLPQLTMPIWPYRLLLWQYMVIYLTSGWDKLMANMWWNGTAVSSSFHITPFMRIGGPVTEWVAGHSFELSRLVVIFELAWLLLLVPDSLWQRMGFRKGGVKRTAIFFGILFHTGILFFMKVGTFPYAMMAGYLGLIKEEDMEQLRKRMNYFYRKKIVVLFDGSCGFCRRSIAWLEMCDWLHRLRPEDYHDPAARHRVAYDLNIEDLDRALHVRIAKQKQQWKDAKTLRGFDAFRAISWHLPPFWLLAPFLYLPGAAFIGRRAYEKIAAKRNRCTDGACLMV